MWELHEGDCLDIMRSLPDASVDAVITDPPYSSGGAFRGDRAQPTEAKYSGWSQNADGSSKTPQSSYAAFTGDTRDQRGYLTWFSLWASQCLRVSKPGAHFLTFTDWRQLPTTTDAVQCAGWVWRGIAVWDKGIGRPMKGRFRNHVEYIVWATNGPVNEQDCYLSSVFRHTPPTHHSRLHRTEKPVDLIRELLPLTPEGGTILDPFAGSGSTLEACERMGRDSIGIEMSAHYCDTIRQRMAAVQPTLL